MRQSKYTDPGRMTKKQLETENSRLQYIADRDWLTGLYNRGAMECRVDEYLKKKLPGTMIVLDLDHFKQVNDRYGHIIGDELLCSVATILNKMSGRQSLVGRVGGDEFVIFMPRLMSAKDMEELFERIKSRFQEIRLKNSILIKLSITIAGADSLGKQRYKNIFDCADQKIMEMKRQRNTGTPRTKSGTAPGSINLDMDLIAGEIEEKDIIPGAYCQDYETFKQVYRLTERRLARERRSVYIILFTLTDQNNEFLSLDIRDREMDLLGKELQNSLRMGDIYTQYSSCQYLVMVSGVSGEDTEKIARRVIKIYYETRRDTVNNLVLHHSYPLKPAEPRKRASSLSGTHL